MDLEMDMEMEMEMGVLITTVEGANTGQIKMKKHIIKENLHILNLRQLSIN